jgi:hypothetical protein
VPSLSPYFLVGANRNCSTSSATAITFNCQTLLCSSFQHLSLRQIKAGKLGPSICLRAYREDASLCPMAIIRTLLVERDALDVRHNRLFFNPSRPDSLVTLNTFKGFIARSLLDAGIDAPPGSMCATAASSALGRGASIGDILRMGNWSNSSTFLRHYALL